MKAILAVLLVFVACGAPAEARPQRDIKVRVAVVGWGQWCSYSPFIGRVVALLKRDVDRRISISFEHDAHFETAGPALTVENFWNRSIWAYWRAVVGSEPDAIRLVILPPLVAPDGRSMFGGRASAICAPRGGGFALVHLGAEVMRDALIVSHELGHLLGARDLQPGQSCPPGCKPPLFGTASCCTPTPPSIMSADAGRLCKAAGYQCGYSAMSVAQVKRCLGMRKAGK